MRFKLVLMAFLFSGLAGALRASADPVVLRVGHFPNITHAQGLIGHQLTRLGRGWFEERLGPGVKLEWHVFNAGPSAMEAIFAKSVDLTYVGPNPAINAHLKTRGEEIRIVAGSCSGGAALVIHPDGPIERDADFKGRRVGTPQLGNTQDIAARAWLKSKGHRVTLAGGDLMVIPSSNPDLLALFQKGRLDAVWTIEPWVSRLELEAGGSIYLDEKRLWSETQGRYATTHLASSVRLINEAPELLRKWISAHVELTEWIQENPGPAKELVQAALEELTRHSLPDAILDRAWERLEFTCDPVKPSLFRSAEDAYRMRLLRSKPDLSRIYELTFLNEILREKQLPEIP